MRECNRILARQATDTGKAVAGHAAVTLAVVTASVATWMSRRPGFGRDGMSVALRSEPLCGSLQLSSNLQIVASAICRGESISPWNEIIQLLSVLPRMFAESSIGWLLRTNRIEAGVICSFNNAGGVSKEGILAS